METDPGRGPEYFEARVRESEPDRLPDVVLAAHAACEPNEGDEDTDVDAEDDGPDGNLSGVEV